MVEEWRAVIGFEGRYEVSNLGRVRSLDRVETYQRKDQYSGRDLTITRTHKGKILRPGRKSSGHLSVVLGRDEGSRQVHHLVLEAFVGPRPDGCEGLHGPTGPDDNRLTNLRWGTRSENISEDYERGVRASGKSHHWADGLYGAALARTKAAGGAL